MLDNKVYIQNLFGIDQVDEYSKYNTKVDIPQYLPKIDKPLLWECYDLSKYIELINKIQCSNVTETEKEFLIFAATRHIRFFYSKIADYYAHSNKEMQDLMEQSSLVIIDYDDKIANGYIELTNDIEEIVKKSGIKPIENYPGRRKKNER